MGYDIDGVIYNLGYEWDIYLSLGPRGISGKFVRPVLGTSVGERSDIGLFEPTELHKVPRIRLINLPVYRILIWFVREPPWLI